MDFLAANRLAHRHASLEPCGMRCAVGDLAHHEDTYEYAQMRPVSGLLSHV